MTLEIIETLNRIRLFMKIPKKDKLQFNKVMERCSLDQDILFKRSTSFFKFITIANQPITFSEKKWECGVDLPGNYLNPMGLGYFNQLFMSMYLGNFEGE